MARAGTVSLNLCVNVFMSVLRTQDVTEIQA